MRAQPPPQRTGLTIVELMAIIAVIALLIAFLIPFSRSGGGQAAQRAQCTNNLKEIGLALYNYEHFYGTLPPAYTTDASGRPLHSWRTLILPYMEQTSLYDSIDLTKPWNDPANSTAAQTTVSAFLCPSHAEFIRPNQTVYLASASAISALLPTTPRPTADIKDGAMNTLLVVEVDSAHAVPWISPQDADPALILELTTSETHRHPGGFNAALANGSVRFLKASIPPDTLRALITANGGETISQDAF